MADNDDDIWKPRYLGDFEVVGVRTEYPAGGPITVEEVELQTVDLLDSVSKMSGEDREAKEEWGRFVSAMQDSMREGFARAMALMPPLQTGITNGKGGVVYTGVDSGDEPSSAFVTTAHLTPHGTYLFGPTTRVDGVPERTDAESYSEWKRSILSALYGRPIPREPEVVVHPGCAAVLDVPKEPEPSLIPVEIVTVDPTEIRGRGMLTNAELTEKLSLLVQGALKPLNEELLALGRPVRVHLIHTRNAPRTEAVRMYEGDADVQVRTGEIQVMDWGSAKGLTLRYSVPYQTVSPRVRLLEAMAQGSRPEMVEATSEMIRAKMSENDPFSARNLLLPMPVDLPEGEKY